MSDESTIWLVGLVVSGLVVLPVLVSLWRKERRTDEAEVEALAYGLNEPASLHPVVDPERCIGTGSCIDVCPEGDVLGLRHGQALAVAPACCIGHGLCERSCPMEAIQLVFGTSKRGVDIPRIRENFETNVPGLFIVGELGGMGLIRNAFEQGRQCVEGIVQAGGKPAAGELDLIIVGCGPGGLSASLTARHHGLRFVTLERESDVGGTVRHYPRKKLVMTAPVVIPGIGKVGAQEIRKEELISLWDRITQDAEVPIETDRTVLGIRREGDLLEVRTNRGVYSAPRVILAIGRRGIPRKLGVPGEDRPTVLYGLAEPEAFEGDRIMVVGGGDSAVEAAIALSEQKETRVHLSYRGEAFRRVKPKNRKNLDATLEAGGLEIHWSTQVQRIEDTQTWLSGSAVGEYAVETDQVFVFAGGELPTPFLTACGVQIDTKFGEA